MNNPKADTALYLLSGLIQRVAKDKPELIEEMLSGIKSDQAAVSAELVFTVAPYLALKIMA